MSRADEVLEGLRQLERQARALRETFTDDDWRCHPIAQAHRRLMREWWTLYGPDVDWALMQVRLRRPSGGLELTQRQLTAKGLLPL